MPNAFSLAPRWPDRCLAAGRFLLFAALFLGLLRVIGWLNLTTRFSPHSFVGQALPGNLEVLAATLLVTWALAWWEHRPMSVFGLGGPHPGRSGLAGFAAGAVLVSLLLGLLKLAGCVVFSIAPGSAVVTQGLAYLVLFLTVALAEETLWRGYALVNLSKAISFWPALGLISLLFALSHRHHQAENGFGILSAALFSLVLGWSFLRLGSLWFAIGLHAGWDYSQSFCYGVPDSGVVVPGSFLKSSLSGPPWLSGGAAGPEGSWLMLAVFAALIWFVRRRSTISPEAGNPVESGRDENKPLRK